MSPIEKQRRHFISLYGKRYARWDGQKIKGSLGCVYCADASGSVDHVPPLSHVDRYSMQEWAARGVKFLLVPACMDCNRMLGARALYSVQERAAYIAKKLEDAYEKNAALWSDAEVSEMGAEFKRTIIAKRRQNEALLDRVRAAQWRQFQGEEE